MGQVTKLPRAEEWADQISRQLAKSVESIIEVGRLLVKAKAKLDHGEWCRLFDEGLVPFGVRSAQMLMAVATNPQLSNTKHVSYLPPSWGTLYALTRVDDKRLSDAFRDGEITPAMPRKAVTALLPPKKTRGATTDMAADDVTDLSTQAYTSLEPARQLARAWPDNEPFDSFIHEARQFVKHLERLEQLRHATISA